MRREGLLFEQEFDVQVRIDDPTLRSKPWTVQLRIGESLDEILDLVEKSLPGVRAERNGNVITISSGPPRSPTAAPRPRGGRVEAGA